MDLQALQIKWVTATVLCRNCLPYGDNHSRHNITLVAVPLLRCAERFCGGQTGLPGYNTGSGRGTIFALLPANSLDKTVPVVKTARRHLAGQDNHIRQAGRAAKQAGRGQTGRGGHGGESGAGRENAGGAGRGRAVQGGAGGFLGGTSLVWTVGCQVGNWAAQAALP